MKNIGNHGRKDSLSQSLLETSPKYKANESLLPVNHEENRPRLFKDVRDLDGMMPTFRRLTIGGNDARNIIEDYSPTVYSPD